MMKITLNNNATGFTLEYLGNEFGFKLAELKKQDSFNNDGVINLQLSEKTSMSLSRDSFLDNLCHHDADERGHPNDYDNEKAIYTIYRLLEGDTLSDIEDDIANIEKQKSLLKAKKKEEIDQITAKRVLESLKREKAQKEDELVQQMKTIKEIKGSIERAEASEDTNEVANLKKILATFEAGKEQIKRKIENYEKEIPEQLKLHMELGEHPTGELSTVVSREMRKLYVGVKDESKPHIKLSNVTPAMIKKEYSEKELQLKLL